MTIYSVLYCWVVQSIICFMCDKWISTSRKWKYTFPFFLIFTSFHLQQSRTIDKSLEVLQHDNPDADEQSFHTYISDYRETSKNVQNAEPYANILYSFWNRPTIEPKEFLCIKPHLQNIVQQRKEWSQWEGCYEDGNKSILQNWIMQNTYYQYKKQFLNPQLLQIFVLST